MNRHTRVPLLGAALLLSSPVVAQEPPGPPAVLRITYEEIKPGSMGIHEKSVASYLALFERAKAPNYRLGLAPVSGDTNQVVYLEAFDSLAALEDVDKKMEDMVASNAAWQAELDNLDRTSGPLHTRQSTVIATYRADLSYRPLKMDAVAKSRYFTINTSRLKPGRAADYADYVKQLNRAREKAGIDDHVAVFQGLSGTPPGTFITVFLNRSLSEIDDFRKGADARTKAIDDALGGESVVRARAERAEQIFAQGSGMSLLYSVNRKLSRPLPQFAAFDAEFWSPKPAPAKALAVKQEEKKP
jgi:hypothetical protein